MSKPANLIIRTKNAIINDHYTLLKPQQKYFPLALTQYNPDIESDRQQYAKMVFRRLCRLKPLVSSRYMVKRTYIDYIRFKFRQEDYDIKRKRVLGESVVSDTNLQRLVRMQNSLIFVIKAVSYITETEVQKFDLARDNTVCRQILKNILTMEYQKHYFVNKYRGASRAIPFQSFYLDYSYIKKQGLTKKIEKKRSKRLKNEEETFSVIGQFDSQLILLNEMLMTIL